MHVTLKGAVKSLHLRFLYHSIAEQLRSVALSSPNPPGNEAGSRDLLVLGDLMSNQLERLKKNEFVFCSFVRLTSHNINKLNLEKDKKTK